MINYIIPLYESCNLKDFEFWGGADDVAEEINNLPNAEECWAFLEEVIKNDFDEMTEDEVNDFLYSDAMPILEGNGFVADEEK